MHADHMHSNKHLWGGTAQGVTEEGEIIVTTPHPLPHSPSQQGKGCEKTNQEHVRASLHSHLSICSTDLMASVLLGSGGKGRATCSGKQTRPSSSLSHLKHTYSNDRLSLPFGLAKPKPFNQGISSLH